MRLLSLTIALLAGRLLRQQAFHDDLVARLLDKLWQADLARPRARLRRLHRCYLADGAAPHRECAVQVLQPTIERSPTELFLHTPGDQLVELELADLISAEGGTRLSYER